MRILITGATGLVGREVGIKLAEKGHTILVFSRNSEGLRESLPFPCEVFKWDPKTGSYEDPGNVDSVLNLAGSPIAESRWTDLIKKEIVDSRVLGTKLVSKLAKEKRAKSIVNATAIGFYGDRGDIWLEESSTAGEGFLSETCQAWEKALFDGPFEGRKCALRIGIVLSRDGGMIKKILPIFLNGAGGDLGSGQQFMSWIHIQDLVNLICEALINQKYQGVINAVAPEPVRNREFTKFFCDTLDVPGLIPTPATALKLALGEMSTMVLGSQKVRSSKLKDLGFEFQYQSVEAALAEQVGLFKNGVRVLETTQYLDHKIEKVWPFFSSEKNLEEITPETLKFSVLGKTTKEMQLGTLINYKLKIHGFPANWQTEIAEWKPPFVFVDMQKKGPFALWRHTHSFQTLGKGTLMRDQVLYKLPMGLLGRAVAGHFIANDIQKIFTFRNKKMMEHFPLK